MGSSPRNTYKSLYQHLQKEFRSGVISLPDDREVLVQLIYSALLENRPAAAALEAFETIENSFIDWNELRVSTARELGELLPMLNDPLNSCERLRQTLQTIFQATYKFDLEEWRDKGEEAFRDYLETIRYVTPFMRSYTVNAVFRKSGVPLDEGAFRVLRLLDLIDVDEANREVPIGLERAFSKSDALEFAKLLHELGAMLMDESTAARAMKVLKAVDPASAERSEVPLVETDDYDPFRIARELASHRKNSPMKMSFDADIDDAEEEEFGADGDSLEEQVPIDGADETADNASPREEPAVSKKKAKTPEKEKKPAEAKASAKEKKPAEAKASAKEKKHAEAKASAKEKKPAEAKAAAKVKKPAEAKAAVKEKKPAETKAAVKEKKPAETKAAAKVKKPAEAKAAAKVKKPVEAKAAVKVKKPVEAKAAAKVKKPAGAKAAAKDKKPLVSKGDAKKKSGGKKK